MSTGPCFALLFVLPFLMLECVFLTEQISLLLKKAKADNDVTTLNEVMKDRTHEKLPLS